MAVIAECSSLLIVSDYFSATAFAVIEVRMLAEFLLSGGCFGRDAVFSRRADLFDLIDRKCAVTEFTGEFLGDRIKFQIGVTIGAFIFDRIQKSSTPYTIAPPEQCLAGGAILMQ